MLAVVVSLDRTVLPSTEYDTIFAVLDDCRAVTSLPELKATLLSSLRERYGFENTTFLAGPSFRGVFADPDPVLTGRLDAIIDEYHERWYPDDMFGTPEAFAALRTSRAICHSRLRRLPSRAVGYVEGFLHRHRLHSASALHLDLAAGHQALVGIFDDESRRLSPQRLTSLGLLAGQLSLLAQTLSDRATGGWRTRLTPRQCEIGELIADGHTNDEIAQSLCIDSTP